MPRAVGLLAVASLAAAACGHGGGAGSVPPVSSTPAAATPAAGPGAAGAAPSTVADGPRAVVLGVVQDGGLPHAACDCRRCRHARAHPGAKQRVAALGLVLPESGRTFLVDATPDVVDQLHDLRAALARAGGAAPPTEPDPRAPGGVDRDPLDGVFLTHAHVGHYLGLAHFGREAVATSGLPVWGTPRMLEFLRRNGPWNQLVELGNVELRAVEPGDERPGAAVELGDGVSVAAIAVPHRDEYSDTVGFVVRGPRATLLYLPDTDDWDAWTVPPEEVMAAAGVDVAFLDGTFASGDELPGRDLSKVRHPFVLDSLRRFAPFAQRTGTRIRFLHFNHSNPALDPFEPLATEGWPEEIGLARQGEEVEL